MTKEWEKIVSRICVREKKDQTPYKNECEMMIYNWLVDYRIIQQRKDEIIKEYGLVKRKDKI